MTKRMQKVLLTIGAFLMLLGLTGPLHSVSAASQSSDSVDIVLHKLLFTDQLPEEQVNNGTSQPNFAQSSRPLNNVTFTAYDISTAFWRYVASGHEVIAAQNHFAQMTATVGTRIGDRITTGQGEAVFDQLPLHHEQHYAVYLFKETKTPTGVTGQSQNLVVVLPGDATHGAPTRLDLYPKNKIELTPSTITKTINAGRSDFDIGQTIPYTLSVKVPADIVALDSFKIADVADPRLARVGDIKVMLDGHDAKGSYTVENAAADHFTVAFDPQALASHVNATLTIQYQMRIKPGTPTDTVLINQTTLYPGDQTPSHDRAVVTTGGKRFVKIDAQTKHVLPGARFVVKNARGQYLKQTATGWQWTHDTGNVVTHYQQDGLYTLTSDHSGQFALSGLRYGHYALIEVQAPTGYVRNQEDIGFQIVPGQAAQQVAPLKVLNLAQPSRPHWPHLPQTGEQWAAWLSVIGLLILVTLYGIARKRRHTTH